MLRLKVEVKVRVEFHVVERRPNRREAPVMEIDALPPAYLGAAPSTHHGGSGHQRQPYQQHYSQPQAPPPSAIAYVSPPLPPEYDTFCMGSPYDVCPR